MTRFERNCYSCEGEDLGVEVYHVKSISKSGTTVRVFSERRPSEILVRRLQRCGDMVMINITSASGTYAKLVK